MSADRYERAGQAIQKCSSGEPITDEELYSSSLGAYLPCNRISKRVFVNLPGLAYRSADVPDYSMLNPFRG